MGPLLEELKRRNVVRVGIAYVVAGGLMIELIDTIASRLGMPDWVPTFIIIAVLMGLPIALFFSWAYELTPQGLKKTVDVDTDTSIAPSTGRRLDFAIIGMLVVALGYFVWDKIADEPALEIGEVVAGAESSPRSIAVLPFVNISSDPEQEYFSDGITEEIIDDLARLVGLKVTARTSAFYFKGKSIPIPEIAKTLGVAYILEGSVRTADNRVRITAQLIRAADGFHVWSDTYERELNDIFAIQDEISSKIASTLKVQLLGIRGNSDAVGRRTKISEAHNLYLQSRPLMAEAHNLYLLSRPLVAERGSENLNQALALLDAAIMLDPDYADAYAAKGAVLSFIISYDYGRTRESVELGVENAVSKALALDANNGQAYLARATSQFFTQGKWLEAKKNLDRALEVMPNDVSVHNFYGDYSIFTMNVDKALFHELRARDLDPISSVHVFDLSQAYAARGDLDKEIELLYTILDFGTVAEYLTLDLLEARQFEEAQALWNDVLKDSPIKESLRGRAMQAAINMVINEEKNGNTLPDVITLALDQDVLQHSFVGRLYLIMGNIDEALEHYKISYETGDSYLYYISFSKTRDQYPDHDGWQAFWDLPGMNELNAIRIKNMNANPDLVPKGIKFGEVR